MKLIYCSICGDVRALRKQVVTCECGKSSGHYAPDGLNAIIDGAAIPLGFANRSFTMAIFNRQPRGKGEQFKAFVISKECSTVAVRGKLRHHDHYYCPACACEQIFIITNNKTHCRTCLWVLPAAKQ